MTPNAPAPPLCRCGRQERLILGSVLGYRSPLRCMTCCDEVSPTDTGDPVLASDLAKWAAMHQPLVDEWVDEGPRAEWAKDQLSRPDSPVSQSARALVHRLSSWKPSFYWAGFAESATDGQCPWCSTLMTVDMVGPSTVYRCDSCRLGLATTHRNSIGISQGGISVGLGEVMLWSDVRRVTAFKRDELTTDLICLRLSGGDVSLEVNEEMSSWKELMREIAIHLPGAMTEDQILAAVVKPPFATTPTVVYDRGAHDLAS